MKKTTVFLLVFLLVFLSGCAAKRVLVKHESCEREPGKAGMDNCELVQEL